MIEGYDRVILGILFRKLFVDHLFYLGICMLESKRNNNVKYKIGMSFACNSSEIVNFKHIIYGIHSIKNKLTAEVDILVVYFYGIHVNSHSNFQILVNVALDSVDQVVGGNKILAASYLGMTAAYHISRSVVMDYHIVNADDPLVLANDIGDFLDGLSVGRLAEKFIYRVLYDFVSGFKNKNRYHNTH